MQLKLLYLKIYCTLYNDTLVDQMGLKQIKPFSTHGLKCWIMFWMKASTLFIYKRQVISLTEKGLKILKPTLR